MKALFSGRTPRAYLLFFGLFFFTDSLYAQTEVILDSIPGRFSGLQERIDRVERSRLFQITGVGVPLILKGLALKGENKYFRDLRDDYLPTFNHHYDDYLQYLPAATLFGLKVAGVEGRSSWGRMLVSDVFAVAIMSVSVNTLKRTTGELRPDGSDRHAFPSGHTATAFMTATMLHKEYGLTRSPWYSVGAYTMATATGVGRVLNDKHWMSDVMVGAGIGILTTEMGYYLADLLFKDKGLLRANLAGESISWDYRPSYFGLYLGMNVIPGKHRLPDGTSISFSTGGAAGVEGAWFATSRWGIGGRFTVANVPVSVNNIRENQSLDLFSGYVGPYFSYPLLPRILVGSKLLVGYNYSPKSKISTGDIGKTGGIGFGTGGSLAYVARQNFGMKLFVDYNFQHPIISSDRRKEHVVTLGGAVNIMF